MTRQKAQFLSAYEAGRQAYLGSRGALVDPLGTEEEHDRLRTLGEWKFILLRGVVGFSVPMFLWMVITHFNEDIQSARQSHQNMITYLLHSWVFALGMSVFLGAIVGLLAWRRLTSDYWPNTKSDPESTLTRMDPL